MDWLCFVDKAFCSVASDDQVSISCGLDGGDEAIRALEMQSELSEHQQALDHSMRHACGEMRSNAARMAACWKDIYRSASQSAEFLSKERHLVDELHAARERSSALEMDLSERRRHIEELRASIDFEDRQTAATLREQRWLVPRVAATVEASKHSAPPAKYNRGWPPAWDEWERGTAATVLSPVAWSGFHCDRSLI
jgi:hypothetical protein